MGFSDWTYLGMNSNTFLSPVDVSMFLVICFPFERFKCVVPLVGCPPTNWFRKILEEEVSKGRLQIER